MRRNEWQFLLIRIGTITVEGTINTLGDVQLYAGKKVNVSGMIQTMTGVSKLPDNIFKHTVNIGDKNVAFESDLTATNVGNGDIVLSAKSSVTDNRKGSADASIDISGKLYGHDITVSASRKHLLPMTAEISKLGKLIQIKFWIS